MKKLLMVLTSIALIAVIGAAGVFGYSSFKNLTENKKDNKTEEVSKKKEDKKENKDQESTNEEVTRQQDQTQEVNSNEQQEQVNTEDQELNPNEEIAKADKDGDGVATTDEMTPELEELTRQGKFQPTSREMYYQDEEQPKGDVGMDLDEQQRNIDAAKAAQDDEE
ncbi:hypothetical protein [Staphylococcus saprophyticus]|uniref:hypothetical protein n=1 Tax=Staphylococcus saprophyticus TaxID=29385 RepID=UPI000E6A0143|nr:hypothetical protein [Staphylococcus saprophyticus]RIO22730.1 hypothetical protein BUZ81_12350 [Staphylococcus saprophyticus]